MRKLIILLILLYIITVTGSAWATTTLSFVSTSGKTVYLYLYDKTDANLDLNWYSGGSIVETVNGLGKSSYEYEATLDAGHTYRIGWYDNSTPPRQAFITYKEPAWTDTKAGYVTGAVALDSTVAKETTLTGISGAISTLDSTVAKDATVMKTASYTAPDNASISAIKTKTDNLPSDPASNTQVATRASQTSVNSIPTNPTLQTTWTDAKAGYLTGAVALDSTVAKAATVALDATVAKEATLANATYGLSALHTEVAKQATLTTLIPEAIPFTSHKVDANATATVDNAAIADAVWDEALSGHVGAGTAGKALGDASAAGDPWNIALPGAYGAGTAGKIIGDYVNASITDLPTLTEIEASTTLLRKTGGSTTNQVEVTADNKINANASISNSDKTEIASRTWNSSYAATRQLTSPLTDELPVRDMSAVGTITGSSQETITVYQTGTITPIPDVGITILDSTEAAVIGARLTNSSGQVVTSLDDGTYKIRARKAGVTFTVPETAVVSGTSTKTIYGTLVDIGAPATVSTCRVYEYLFNADDTTIPATVTAKAKIISLPYNYNGKLHIGTFIDGTFSATTGLVYWDIVYGAKVQFIINNFVDSASKTIPSTTTARLSDITD